MRHGSTAYVMYKQGILQGKLVDARFMENSRRMGSYPVLIA